MPSNSSRKPTVFLVLLIFAVFATGTCKDNNDDCRKLWIRSRIEGKVLEGHVLKKLVLNTEAKCEMQCFLERDCVSYNVGPQDDKYECELSDSNHHIHPNDFKNRTGFSYTPFENFCSSSPCPTNSRCQTGFTDKGFRCVPCSTGFTGKDCKTELPVVSVTFEMLISQKGINGILTCNATGQPKPVIKWTKSNRNLSSSSTITTEENLTILNVTTNDKGSYVCTATNSGGSQRSVVELRVNYTRIFAYFGQALSLSCSVPSDLPATVTWLYNGSRSLPRGVRTDTPSKLVIPSVEQHHVGNYTCVSGHSLLFLKRDFFIHFFPETCSKVKAVISDVSGDYVIDPDGDKGVDPFTVYCNMTDKGGVGVTVVSHDSEERRHVIGYEDPGSYERDVHYSGSSISQLGSLTKVSLHCQQFIRYECKGSVLRYRNEDNDGWWVSRDGEQMTYWGGADLGDRCACGINRTCADPSLKCNCDKNDYVWREDSGFLTNKSHLPVSQLRFGDTGHSGEEGYHTLGKLQCYGQT